MTRIYDAAIGRRNLISLRLWYGCVFFWTRGLKMKLLMAARNCSIRICPLDIISMRLKNNQVIPFQNLVELMCWLASLPLSLLYVNLISVKLCTVRRQVCLPYCFYVRRLADYLESNELIHLKNNLIEIIK